MDKKSWDIVQDIYEKHGDLNLKDFEAKIDQLSLTDEIRVLLVELKRSEKEASGYFDELKESASDYLEPKLSELLEILRKRKP